MTNELCSNSTCPAFPTQERQSSAKSSIFGRPVASLSPPIFGILRLHVIMPNGIFPRKAKVLTQFSYFWFAQTQAFPAQPFSRARTALAPKLQPFADKLARRAMLVQKTSRLPSNRCARLPRRLRLEGISEKQSVCGIKLPPGLQGLLGLPEPCSPATKAESGHDEKHLVRGGLPHVGQDIAERARAPA